MDSKLYKLHIMPQHKGDNFRSTEQIKVVCVTVGTFFYCNQLVLPG